MTNKKTNTEWDDIALQLEAPLSDELKDLLDKANEHQKWPVAQLISLFERNTTESFIARHQIISHMAKHSDAFNKRALIMGITGTPGAGKSSLIGALCKQLLQDNPALSIAVLAIDPSSQDSGGALLGDRTRTQFPINDNRLFFRSQASHQDLGGMGKRTFHVTRILRRLFDVIIIETVGIGQSEIEVQRLSDQTCLVMQPLAGDQVQFMKAGIMEVPDTFIINKCDEESLARKSYQLLRASLKLAKIYIDDEATQDRSIFLTSATKNKGIGELSEHVLNTLADDTHASREALLKQENYFLNKWIKEAYGEFGLGVRAHLEKQSDHQHKSDANLSFEQRELAFKQGIEDFVRHVI